MMQPVSVPPERCRKDCHSLVARWPRKGSRENRVNQSGSVPLSADEVQGPSWAHVVDDKMFRRGLGFYELGGRRCQYLGSAGGDEASNIAKPN